MTTPTTAPLTDDDTHRLDGLVKLLNYQFIGTEPALVRAALNGQPVAVLVALSQPDAETYRADPVAILVDDRLMQALDPGEGVDIESVNGSVR